MKNMKKLNIKHTIMINLINIYEGITDKINIKRVKIDMNNKYVEENIEIKINMNPGFNPRETIIMKNHGNFINNNKGNLIIDFKL